MNARVPGEVDLNLLRSLHALLEAGSVSGAARSLGITQAAASNALRRLREHYEDALLVRAGARMQPTPLAVRLQPMAAQAMQATRDVLVPERSFEPETARGRIRIATSDHVQTVALEPFATRLARTAPEVELAIEPFSPASMKRTVDGDVDLVIAPRTQMPDALRTTRVLEEPYAAVVRQRHPALVEGDVLTLAEFADHEHVLVAPAEARLPVRTTETDRALERHKLRRHVTRVVTSFSQALLLVSVTDLVAVIPSSFAKHFAARLRLAVCKPPLSLSPCRLDAAWSPRLHDDPLHAWFRHALVESARAAAE